MNRTRSAILIVILLGLLAILLTLAVYVAYGKTVSGPINLLVSPTTALVGAGDGQPPIVNRLLSLSGGSDSDTDSDNNKPVADAGPDQTVNEGILVTLSGIASSDPDGDSLTYSWVQISGPTVTLSDSTSVNPTFTAPLVSSTTTLTFRLIVNDGEDNSSPDTVTITVNDIIPGANNPPVASDVSLTTAEDTPIVANFVCSDIDGDTLTYIIVADPGYGTLSGTGNSRTYTPNTDFVGGDVFAYKCNDGSEDSNIAMVSITVTPVNDAPVVSLPSTFSFDEDSSGTLDLNEYVSDVDNLDSELTWTFSGNTEINIVIDSDNIATFTATADWSGTETITFTATDPSTASGSDSMPVTVNPVDDPATWNPLSNKNINEDSPNGTVVYSSIISEISDSDGPFPITAEVVSTHNFFELEFLGNDLIVTNLTPNWYGTEIVTLESSGAQASFTFTVNQLNDDWICIPGYGSQYCMWL